MKSNDQNLLPKIGEVYLTPEFFSALESELFLENLRREILWKHEPIMMFGKKVMQPRLTALYGDTDKTYRYSGVTMKPEPWTETLLEIKRRIEKVSDTEFTTVLLNQYRDERDSMGWHRDNEKELGINPVIGSVSFGAARIFQFRHYDEKSLKINIDLTDGSYLLMRGETQHRWEHALPKRKSVRGTRVNLTFRKIL